MVHVILMGDSVFDNGAYVSGGPDVAAQLNDLLAPQQSRATLLAVDGAVARSVHAQLTRMPADATHVVLSAGGNDALRYLELLERPIRRGADVFELMEPGIDEFAVRYRQLLDALVKHPVQVRVCTIYDGRLEERLRVAARVAVGLFNDRIQRVAREFDVPVIELRDIFTSAADYANPIEPSTRGGAKLARAVVESVGI